eukprot:gene9605-10429_t
MNIQVSFHLLPLFYLLFLCLINGVLSFQPLSNSLLRFRSQQRMNLFAQIGIVTMYKKEGCPHCAKAKDLLENKYQLKVTYVDVQNPDAATRDNILYQMRTFSGGRNTVPQIFFNAEHLGGNDDVQKLDQEGKLVEKVEKVKTTQVTMMQDHWYHPWY